MGRKPRGGRAGSNEGAERLSRGVARGDRSALDEFYRLWFDWSFRLAQRLTRRDESFCLDVVQEAMIRVARSMKGMKSRGDLERWMTRVVHTAALDQLRRESRRTARERARATVAGIGDAGAAAELKERIEWVRARLAGLPARDGWLVWLRFGRGRTLAQAGQAEGMGGQAAHGRIRRALVSMAEAEREAANEPV